MGIKTKNQIIKEEDIKRVKGLGCLKDKRYSDIFNVRVLTKNGKMTTSDVQAIINAADKYGCGEVAFTARQTIEIQGVQYENIELLKQDLNQKNILIGGTGPKVRPVVSCKGTTCQYGLIDTFSLSEQIHEVFYVGYHEVVLPHKFKIAVGGCPNNCVKPELNDIGIIGQSIQHIDLNKCKSCKVCNVIDKCPMKAVEKISDEIIINKEICNNCGRCIKFCPFNAVEFEKAGYKVYIGGRWGKKTNKAEALNKIFTNEEEVIEIIKGIIANRSD